MCVCLRCLQETITKLETNLEQHKAYQESCSQLVTWLRVSREKLVTCRDTHGDKMTLLGKMDRVQVRHCGGDGRVNLS